MPHQRHVASSNCTRGEILDQVLREHHRGLLSRARLHSVNPADAEDALNEASLAFLRNYNGPPGDAALRWLATVVKYTAWSLSRDATERRFRHRPETDLLAAPADTGADRISSTEDLEVLLRHLRMLKPDERIALLLFGFGFTYSEIAELRCWSARKTARCIYEGRRRLRTLAQYKKTEERGSIR